jgi:glycosyltransferase involved in cell wall biosynthesis
MQQTDFPIEILIHDDCSTDGTTEIIREYEAKYPDLIFPLYEEENQYQHGKAAEIDFYNYRRARGKYIAYCEGDDYWTDPLKLQKQVDFMEANPEYSVCWHRYDIYDEIKKQYRSDACGIYLKVTDENKDITIDMFLRHWVTQPLTMMYRSGVSLGGDKKYTFYRDQHTIFHLLQAGKGALLNFNAGVYREHHGGIHSKISVESQCGIGITIARELYQKNGEIAVLKQNYIRYIDWGINVFSKTNKKKALSLIYKRFYL